MGKVSNSKDPKKWQRTEWHDCFISPVRDGLYEVKVIPTHEISLETWENGSWQSKNLSSFQWRGLTECQYQSLPLELSFIPFSEDEEKPVPCFSCGEPHFENDKDLHFWSGQYICPDCGEGWIMADARDEIENDDE